MKGSNNEYSDTNSSNSRLYLYGGYIMIRALGILIGVAAVILWLPLYAFIVNLLKGLIL